MRIAVRARLKMTVQPLPSVAAQKRYRAVTKGNGGALYLFAESFSGTDQWRATAILRSPIQRGSGWSCPCMRSSFSPTVKRSVST